MINGASIACRVAELRREADALCLTLCAWHLREARRQARDDDPGWAYHIDMAEAYATSFRDDKARSRVVRLSARLWRHLVRRGARP